MAETRSLEDVYRRLEALEDERAIQALLVQYCLACDSHDAGAPLKVYAADARIEIDGQPFSHTATAPGSGPYGNVCSHVMGPFMVQIDGDRASATGYGTVYAREGDEVRLWRHAYGRWELAKQAGQWRITRRTSLTAGREDGRDMLKAALPG